MTNISIIAFGTRGDVQPAIALGKTLHSRGYHVRLLAGANFSGWIRSHGLDVAENDVDIQELMRSDEGQDWVEHGTKPLAQVRLMRRMMAAHGHEMAQAAWEGCQGADVVISSFTSDVLAVSITEKLGAVHASMPVQPPMIATRDGRALFNAPLPNRVSIVNYLFGKLFLEPFPWQLLGDVNNRFRQQTLGLPPQSRRQNTRARLQMLTLLGYSHHVVPRPADLPPSYHNTGYWFLDEDTGWEPSPDLLQFLEAGPPPVYIGFGSMTGRDPRALTQLLLQAVELSGCRAILLSGWAGLSSIDMPDTVFCLDSAPHEWLFPRMAAVVHHGGSGTTAAGLRAGVPTIIVPHLGDQVFWGRRVSQLGVGPNPLPRPKLNAHDLADAMRRATSNATMRQRAADLGMRIRDEDGRARAAVLLERWIERQKS
jgi:UDP:flavonoid glycosyltransferase YjiC (YdhE family)